MGAIVLRRFPFEFATNSLALERTLGIQQMMQMKSIGNARETRVRAALASNSIELKTLVKTTRGTNAGEHDIITVDFRNGLSQPLQTLQTRRVRH